MLNKVDTRYLDKSQTYLIALSGGADSVALLSAMLQLGYNLEAAHCNFHLRGSESDRDEQFCKDLCSRLGVKLHIAHFDTKAYASKRGISIEMAARDLRYSYFNSLITRLPEGGGTGGEVAVLTAHHLDDQTETVLLNLIRGTGLEGLKGMLPKNGSIIRPLLNVSREEILDYLASIHQDYVTDSTNLEDDVQRNIIRHRLIPLLLSLNPQASVNIAKTAEFVADALPLLSEAIKEAHGRLQSNAQMCSLDISSLLSEPSPQTILWYWLKDKDFSSAQVEQIFNSLDAQSGKVWESKTHRLLLDRDKLILEEKPKRPSMDSPTLSIEHLSVFNFQFSISRFPETADLDADKVKEPLTLRPVRQGDWFIPFGMKGRKLVSDYLTDRKVSLFDKQRQLVVEDASGRIVWLVNQRPDNRFAVTSETTNILRLTLF